MMNCTWQRPSALPAACGLFALQLRSKQSSSYHSSRSCFSFTRLSLLLSWSSKFLLFSQLVLLSILIPARFIFIYTAAKILNNYITQLSDCKLLRKMGNSSLIFASASGLNFMPFWINQLHKTLFFPPPFVFDSVVLYECCPGYIKLEGMRGCPAGMVLLSVV